MRPTYPAATSVLVVIFVAVPALASGQLLYQVLGALALFIAGLLLLQELSGSRLEKDIRQKLGLPSSTMPQDELRTEFPRETLADRLFPPVFLGACVIIVLALTAYTISAFRGW